MNTNDTFILVLTESGISKASMAFQNDSGIKKKFNVERAMQRKPDAVTDASVFTFTN